MRHLSLLPILLLFISGLLRAQVGISTDNSAPHPSAILDVKSTEKGFLPPRMTMEQRNAIENPAEGLIVFCTDCTVDGNGILSVYRNGSWTVLSPDCISPPATISASHVTGCDQIVWNWNANPAAYGYRWNTVNDLSTSMDIGLAVSRIETGLECNTPYTRYLWAYDYNLSYCYSAPTILTASTLPVPPPSPVAEVPSPTSTSILWIWNPAPGAHGYKWSTSNNYSSAIDMGTQLYRNETGLACNTACTRYLWAYNACGPSQATVLSQSTLVSPDPPVAGAHIPALTQILWKWLATNGATGYKWNSANDYGTATDMGASLMLLESGLTCNTSYTRYVFSYNSCGHSSEGTLVQSTTMNPPETPTAGTHVPTSSQITWNWNSVPGATGYRWNTTNDYATATDMVTATSKTETGLTCNKAYTRYAWSYGTCGNSIPLAMLQATSTSNVPNVPTAGTHVPSVSQIVWNWNTASGAAGYKWNTTNDYATATDMGTSRSKTETGLSCNTAYSRYVWAYSSCRGVSAALSLTQTTSILPATPVTGINFPALTQIIWNWSPAAGATGYKWNTTNDPGTATDLGDATTKTETGLTQCTNYTRYIWAYNSCGISASTVLTSRTTSCGISLVVNHVAGEVAPESKTVIYGTITNIPGEMQKCWITRNLGASRQATAVDDGTEASAGWYWQFNRKQGFKHDGITRTPNTTWITEINENSDWLTSNDPCNIELGGAWRVPTGTEWFNVDGSGSWGDWNGPWNSNLKLHAAGYLRYDNGSLTSRNSVGEYWGSIKGSMTGGYALEFYSYYCATYSDNLKSYGYSLRCIRDN